MKSRLNRVLCLLLVILTLSQVIPGMAISVSAAYENTYQNTGDQRADIIGVARTQLGYMQGSYGYTKYGAWYGDPYMDWCGAFISWCARQAGVPESILQTSGYVTPRAEHFNIPDVFRYSSGRTPQPGDIFFVMDGNIYEHAGIVYYVSGSYFYTLEGNTHDGSGIYGVYCRERRLTGSYLFASPKYFNNNSHTHSYNDPQYESAHPHREYKTCIFCGEKVFTGKNGTLSGCTTCKQENCTHSYGNYVKISDEKHRATCTKCGKQTESNHNYQSMIQYESAHPHREYKVCASCNEKTYTGNNGTVLTCITCKQANCSHNYENFVRINDEKHRATCTKCEKQSDFTHLWQTAVVVKEANCKEPGLKTQQCRQCNAILETEIPISNVHAYGDYLYNGDEGHKRVCEICGIEEESIHYMPQEWMSDPYQHWHACEDCGGRLESTPHRFPKGCESACKDCGYIAPEGHMYGTVYQTDEESHWYVCHRCGDIKEEDTHIFSDACDEDCDICGYVRKTAHNYGDTYKSDPSGHWRICTNCEARSPVERHGSGAIPAEGEALTCKTCGFVMMPAVQHQHTFEVVAHNSQGHSVTCSCGLEKNGEAHSWDPETEQCSICQEAVPVVGKQSAVMAFVAEKVGVGSHLWLVLVLPIVGLLILVMLGVFLLLFVRKRSLAMAYGDYDDYDDDDDDE